MLAFELEQALRQLEESTETLLSTEASDLVALCRALDHRANAITKLALISEESQAGGEGSAAVERLAAVLVRGESATRKLLAIRRETSDELVRLKQVRQGLPPDPPAAPGIELKG